MPYKSQLHSPEIFLSYKNKFENKIIPPFFKRARQHVKNFRIQSFSGPYIPAYRLNTKIDKVNLRIQFKCGKIRTRKTPNMDTFPQQEFLLLDEI